MKRKQLAALAACMLVFPMGAMAASVTTNVPLDSVYYSYIEKLSGMGYISSMPNGAKPYSRMEMAKWVQEAQKKEAEKPMPAYLQSQMQALETYLAPELAALQGEKLDNPIKIRTVTAEAAYNHSDTMRYGYRNIKAGWQPFGENRNGYSYGRDGNIMANVEVSGNLNERVAVSLRPRFSYDKDNDGSASLEEGYIKTSLGIWHIEAGKQALMWGQGTSGHLLLGNNMKPLTTLQLHFDEPKQVGGFFRFLGKADFHAFYGMTDKDRRDDAASWGRTDYDDAGLLGLRLDITPTSYFTFGASRVSMLGGKNHGLSKSDWKHWVTGTNDSQQQDRWNDIAGFDFRLRLPGVQFYGEAYGEDQAHSMPCEWAYRGGVYLPRLTKDGSWDMTLEMAQTNEVWYQHGTYQNGWTYSGDIMGDAMGRDARKYYGAVKHYLPNEAYLGMYYQRTQMNRSSRLDSTVDEAALMGQRKLAANTYLRGTLGLARVRAAGQDNAYHRFATASVQWMY